VGSNTLQQADGLEDEIFVGEKCHAAAGRASSASNSNCILDIRPGFVVSIA
jgi:hypothetical protein